MVQRKTAIWAFAIVFPLFLILTSGLGLARGPVYAAGRIFGAIVMMLVIGFVLEHFLIEKGTESES